MEFHGFSESTGVYIYGLERRGEMIVAKTHERERLGVAAIALAYV